MSTPPATDLFISYTRSDGDFVDRLEPDLKERGYNVWIDRRKLEGGQVWTSEIREAIQRCRTFLVVLSPDAVASRSVRTEWQYALRHGKRVVPLLYHPCTIPRPLRKLHWIEFRAGANFDTTYSARFPDLLRAIASPAPPASAFGLPALLKGNGSRAGLALVILLSGILVGRAFLPSTAHSYSAAWHGQPVTLTPSLIQATPLEQLRDGTYRGFAVDFTTDDRNYTCIRATPADKLIPVYTAPSEYPWPAHSNLATYVVRVACASGILGTWTFEAPAPPARGYTYQAQWHGHEVSLKLTPLPSTPDVVLKPVTDAITEFFTNDPAYTCFEGSSLQTYTVSTYPHGQYLVFDTCLLGTSGSFEFTAPSP